MVQKGHRESLQGQEANNCATELKNRKAAGADMKVNDCMKYGGGGMLTGWFKNKTPNPFGVQCPRAF